MRLMAFSIFLSLMRPLGRQLMEMAVIFILLVCLWGGTLESDTTIGIRLMNSPRNCSGRVEVFYNGQWRTICDDHWDIMDARVVCQQLGCGEARAATDKAQFGSGTGPIWQQRINCNGTESALSECPTTMSGVSYCQHAEDAGVICSGANLESETSAEIRLVNGFSNCSGRVEVFHNGSWGTICDDSWDIKEARIVCQQLGCGEARAAPGEAQFGRGTGEIWLDDVHCNGRELALIECSAEKWGSHNCHHGEDAGVICSGGTSESESWDTESSLGIRLVNGQSNCSGRVEVLHDGQWGTICDDLWDIIDARIVCKEMGCGQATLAPSGHVFGSGTGPIWLDDVQCTGTESSLSQCPARRWETHKCSHSEDVAVICVDNEPHHSPLTLWLPALCVLLATALLVLGGIIWYFTSKWKGSWGDGVQLDARNIIDGDM